MWEEEGVVSACLLKGVCLEPGVGLLDIESGAARSVAQGSKGQ